MKLRSLFLASIAALAMASCSNEENEVVDNAGKTALMQFSMEFPNAIGTRAADVDADGTAVENEIKTINVRVSYAEGTPDDVFHRVVTDFDRAAGSNVYSLKAGKLLKVSPSTGATVYVTVNGDSEVTNEGTIAGAYDATTASIITGVAEPNNFLMSGKTDATVEITQNVSTNTASVNVDRVVAKIAEKTNLETMEKSFAATTVALVNNEIVPSSENLTAVIQNYALCNLNKNTNIFAMSSFAVPDFFQPYVAAQNNAISYENFVAKDISSTTTYCLENNSTTNLTSVIYQVKFKYADAENTTGDFFTYEKTTGNTFLYKTFGALDKDNNYIFTKNFGLSATSNFEDLRKAGVTKYIDGIAYYIKPILTGTDTKIVRNNFYKLNVTKITGIGNAVLDPAQPAAPTLLQLEVTVKKWTVNQNNIIL